MSVRLLELAVDLWMFGVPVVGMVWGLVRMLRPARVRYVVAIVGFLAVIALPFLVSALCHPERSEGPPVAREEGVLRFAQDDMRVVARAVTPQFAMLWAAIAFLLLARDFAGHARLRRAQRAWTAAPDALKQSLAWPPDVPLFVAPDAAPMTTGLLRPRVVVPGDLPVGRLIALHELAHVRWRDPLVYATLRAIAALFWMAPVWPLLRWIRREREIAADEQALRGSTGQEEHYVAALLQLSQTVHGLAPAMAASDLEYRAERILLARTTRPSFAAVLVLALGATLIAFAEPARIAADEDEVIVLSSRAFVPAAEIHAERRHPGSVQRQQRKRAAAEPVVLPIIRSLTATLPGTLPPPEPRPEPPPPQAETVHVDVHQAVARHVDRHIIDDGPDVRNVEKDDEVIRIVVRDRRRN